MLTNLLPPQRLIIAADFKPAALPGPGAIAEVENRVLDLAGSLKGTGVVIKVNSILRAAGYRLIGKLRDLGLSVFADLKVCDISETLETDGMLLAEARPEILTAMCAAGTSGLIRLKSELAECEVLGVTFLTHLTDNDALPLHGCTAREATMRYARIAFNAGLDGVIAAPAEIAGLRAVFGAEFGITTPGIRPGGMVGNDDQNPARSMTPAQAIKAGARRIVVGRPVTRAADPRRAALEIVEGIAAAA